MRTPGAATSSTASEPGFSSPERRALITNNDVDVDAAPNFNLGTSERNHATASHAATSHAAGTTSPSTHADELRTQYTSDYTHAAGASGFSRPGTGSTRTERSEVPQTAPTRFRSHNKQPDLQAIKGSPHRHVSPVGTGTGASAIASAFDAFSRSAVGVHSPTMSTSSSTRERPATPSPRKLDAASRSVDDTLEETRRMLAVC